MPHIFFISGASSGLGRAYAQEVLNRGDFLIATARNLESLDFTGTSEQNYLPLRLEFTDRASISVALRQSLDTFGRIDVLVNNAGHGLAGVFEGLTESEIHRAMNVNFFGVLDMTRAAIQIMRDQDPRGGIIQQVTSMSGQRGVPLMSMYCASKWAVEGFTEAISQEMDSAWNIKFTCIEPGGFRTNFFNSITIQDQTHQAYSHLDPHQLVKTMKAAQRGDPTKAGRVMYELAMMKDPPLRIVLGSDAFGRMATKLEQYNANLTKYEHISRSTDVDGD